MDVGPLGGRHDRLAVQGAEPADVFRDRAVEQLDILRQVADEGAAGPRIPALNIDAVEPDGAGIGPPSSDQQTGQG
jgi:hypothetical protein